MNSIELFKNEELGCEVRTLVIDEETWFVGKDICDALEYTNSRKAIIDNVDEDDVTSSYIIDSIGRNQLTTVINESGLYSLIISSKLPTAKKFKKWVTSEVLPQIRKTGGYIPVQEEDSDEVIMAKALQIMNKTLEKKDELIASQNKLLEEQKPKVDAYEDLMDSDGLFTTRSVSKLVGYKEKDLFELLKSQGLIYRSSKGWMPYANPRFAEFMKVKVSSYDNHTHMQLYWTTKGLDYIRTLVIA